IAADALVAILAVVVQLVVAARLLEQVGVVGHVGLRGGDAADQQERDQGDAFHDKFSMFDRCRSYLSVASAHGSGSRRLDYKSDRWFTGVAKWQSSALIRRRSVVQIGPPAPAFAALARTTARQARDFSPLNLDVHDVKPRDPKRVRLNVRSTPWPRSRSS